MITADTIARSFCATQEEKELFLDTIRTKGEVYVNYLMGATLHYVMVEMMVCEKQDYDGSIFGCFNILDADEKLEDWVDLSGVASITDYNISSC